MYQLPPVVFKGVNASDPNGQVTHLVTAADLGCAALDDHPVREVWADDLAHGVDRCRLTVSVVGRGSLELLGDAVPSLSEPAEGVAERDAVTPRIQLLLAVGVAAEDLVECRPGALDRLLKVR